MSSELRVIRLNRGSPFVIEHTKKLLAFLAQDLSQPEFQLETTPEFDRVSFARHREAEYAFEIYVYPDGDADISAVMVVQEDPDFHWHLPFENLGSPDIEGLLSELVSDLGTLLTHPTRIVQDRGLLWWSYSCEALVDSRWTKIGGSIASLRWPFSGLRREAKRRIYSAPPVAPPSLGGET